MDENELKRDGKENSYEKEFCVYTGKEPFLFASYSHTDWQIVNGILRILFREGFRIWYDEQAEGIPAGKEWKEVIDERLSACQVFILFLSNGVEERPEVLREFDAAREQRKPIIPILLQRVSFNDFSKEQRDFLEKTQSIGLWKFEGVTEKFANQLLSAQGLTADLIDKVRRRKCGLPDWNPEHRGIPSIENFWQEDQYIYLDANPHPVTDVKGRISYYQVSPGETDPEAVYPLAMDNQWCPVSFYEDDRFRDKGFTSETLLEEKQTLQRAEFYRGLLHSLQVIINRAYFQNSPIFLHWYQSGASPENRSAFGRLLKSGVIVLYLYQENSPWIKPKYGTPDLEELKDFCRDYPPYCLRMDWQDEETNKKETESQLHLAFHKYCVMTAEDKYHIENMANYFQLADESEKKTQFRKYWKQIQTTALRYCEEHDGNGYKREEFYKDFLVCQNSKVEDCILKPDGLFTKELKQVIDLCYNRNLAQALGLKLLIPSDMKSMAEAIKGENALSGQREVSAEELIYAIKSFSTQFLQRAEVWVAENPDFSIAQVEKMRTLPEWREYVRAKDAGQKRSRQWDIDFHDIGIVWERYQKWMEKIKENFPGLQWKQRAGAISIIYRFGGKEWKAVYRAGSDEPEWEDNQGPIGTGKVQLTIDYICGDAMDPLADSCLQTEIRFYEGITRENGASAEQTFKERVVQKGTR